MWCGLFIIVEVPLLIHLVGYSDVEHAIRAGSFQWIVYSWVHGAKTWILYFEVMPNVQAGEGPTMYQIVQYTCLTPVFYTMLALRGAGNFSGKSKQRAHPSREDKHAIEAETLDAVILQDMVWHVAVDMIDAISMLFYSRPRDPQLGLGDAFLAANASEVENIRIASGVFVVLSFFFHQQSFPNVGNALQWQQLEERKSKRSQSRLTQRSLARATEDSAQDARGPNIQPQLGFGRRSSQSTTTPQELIFGRGDHAHSNWSAGPTFNFKQLDVARKETSSSCNSTTGNEPWIVQGPGMQRSRMVDPEVTSALTTLDDAKVNVVKARKRSAIVSILLVDLPFLVLRIVIYGLTYQHYDQDAQDDQASTPTLTSTILNTTTFVTVTWAASTTSAMVSNTSGVLPSISNPPGFFFRRPGTRQQPYFDRMLLKNFVCLGLQALQLRFVQVAEQDLTRHENEKAMRQDLKKSDEVKKKRRASMKVRKTAFEAASPSIQGASFEAAEAAAGPAVGPQKSGLRRASSWLFSGRSTSGTDTQPVARSKNCCCLRRSCFGGNFCIYLIMGFCTGWFLAKHDFTASQDTLKFAVLQNLTESVELMNNATQYRGMEPTNWTSPLKNITPLV